MALKGIEKVVAKFTVQTCVYWGNPQSDGKGGFTFDDPVEISCRWDDKQETKVDTRGNKFESQSAVLVLQDIDHQSYLFNGTLADLAAMGYAGANPRKIPTAFIVRQFDKIPMVFKTDEFVRTAYLYDQG